jgi:hypothetical protein
MDSCDKGQDAVICRRGNNRTYRYRAVSAQIHLVLNLHSALLHFYRAPMRSIVSFKSIMQNIDKTSV